MPGENIQDWSVTAANNSTADTSINWAEGQPRASVNNSARSMMAAHAKLRNLQNGSITTGGVADAYTFISGVGYTAVPTGLRVLLKIHAANTGAPSLNMDGIGAVGIKLINGANPFGGELVANGLHEFIYDGTNWITTSAIGAAVLLSAQAASDTAQIMFTDLFGGNYTHYLFDLALYPNTPGSAVICQLSSDNGVSFGTSYSNSWIYVVGGAGLQSFAGGPDIALWLTPDLPDAPLATQFCVMDLMLHGYQWHRTWGYANGQIYHRTGGGAPSDGGLTINAVRFGAPFSNISGLAKMYALRG